jgi:hypothetical protein
MMEVGKMIRTVGGGVVGIGIRMFKKNEKRKKSAFL